MDCKELFKVDSTSESTKLLGVLKLRYQNVAAWNVRKSFIFGVLMLCQNVNQKNNPYCLLSDKINAKILRVRHLIYHDLSHVTPVCSVG